MGACNFHNHSSVGTIVIASLLGESEYAIYAIALTAPNLIVTFRDWSMPSAMVRYLAQYKSENNNLDVKN
jgi:O-antigen/teichoic acid export membrane protein